MGGRCGALVFTGPIDLYFASEGLPKLQYRCRSYHSYSKSPQATVSYHKLQYRYRSYVIRRHQKPQ